MIVLLWCLQGLKEGTRGIADAMTHAVGGQSLGGD
jgi:hypothetical protein